MSVATETPSLFAKVIQDHLELKQRNAPLEPSLPLERYKGGDPFENHPLFKTEEQARLEETMDGEVTFSVDPSPAPWPGELQVDAEPREAEAHLWSRSRDFDWGD